MHLHVHVPSRGRPWPRGSPEKLNFSGLPTQKAVERGVETDGMREGFVELGVVFEPFTADHAETAALLRARTRERGLSLADRACLALALDRGLRVVTADRAWAELGLEVEVELIR